MSHEAPWMLLCRTSSSTRPRRRRSPSPRRSASRSERRIIRCGEITKPKRKNVSIFLPIFLGGQFCCPAAQRTLCTGPKRQPLPPQEKTFMQRLKGTPPPPFPPSSMPPMSARFPPPSAEASHGPRDTMPPPAVQRLPSGPRQTRGPTDTRGGRPPHLQVDTDEVPPPRDAPSPSQGPSAAPSYALAGPAAPIRAGSGMYADREALATPVSGSTDGGGVPRGPRAMSTTTPGGSFGYGAGAPPVGSEGGLGRGSGSGRGRDRSPPPHMGGHGERMPPRGATMEGYRGRGVGQSFPGASSLTDVLCREEGLLQARPAGPRTCFLAQTMYPLERGNRLRGALPRSTRDGIPLVRLWVDSAGSMDSQTVGIVGAEGVAEGDGDGGRTLVRYALSSFIRGLR